MINQLDTKQLDTKPQLDSQQLEHSPLGSGTTTSPDNTALTSSLLQRAASPVNTSPPDIIGTFVMCDGMSGLVVEVLNKPHNTYCPERDQCKVHKVYTEQDVIEALAKNLKRLQDLTKAKTIAAAFTTSMMVLNSFNGKIHSLEPFESGKVLTAMMGRLAELTDTKTHDTNLNVNNMLFQEMTPRAQEAWLFIQKNQHNLAQPEVIDHDPTLYKVEDE
jgi:hypothetical protein